MGVGDQLQEAGNMKSNTMRTMGSSYAAKLRPARAPTRTIAEFADEFGLKTRQLMATMQSSSVPPPKPTHQTKVSHYECKAMRDWWAAHQAEGTK
jgi:hypothetical protein